MTLPKHNPMKYSYDSIVLEFRINQSTAMIFNNKVSARDKLSIWLASSALDSGESSAFMFPGCFVEFSKEIHWNVTKLETAFQNPLQIFDNSKIVVNCSRTVLSLYLFGTSELPADPFEVVRFSPFSCL